MSRFAVALVWIVTLAAVLSFQGGPIGARGEEYECLVGWTESTSGCLECFDIPIFPTSKKCDTFRHDETCSNEPDPKSNGWICIEFDETCPGYLILYSDNDCQQDPDYTETACHLSYTDVETLQEHCDAGGPDCGWGWDPGEECEEDPPEE